MQPNMDPNDVGQVFTHWIERFGHAFESGDAAAIAAFVERDGYWKDILSFTWSYKTFTGRDEIEKALKYTLDGIRPRGFRVSANRAAPRLVRRSARSVIEGYFDFDTEIGEGSGFVRLAYDPANPAEPIAGILLTTLQQLRGFEEQIDDRRPSGENFAYSFSGDNWLDARLKEQRYDDRQPEVLIVGAGQSGLSLAARLRAIGVDALVIERHARLGDNWRQRYHSLTLHNEVWANSLPYLEFPRTWPTFLPKDKLAGWLEFYAEAMELNVWTGTELEKASYDEQSRTWSASLQQSDGTSRELTVPHLVMATGGASGVPNMPAMHGIDTFSGEVLHSAEFNGGTQYAGRKAIVVGTGNSGHDVAQDLYSNGAESVSIVQRDSTCVVSLVPSGTLVYSLYSEGPPAEDIDLITAAIPYPVLKETYQWLTKRIRKLDKELLDKLAAVGFETDQGEDDTGFHMKYLRTGGGYYINVGCSDLIAERKINLIQASDIIRFDETGLQLAGGNRVDADLIVMATGYRNLQEGVRALLGDEVADRVGPIWGFDEDATMRNMWKRTAQPGLWFMGGALMECRLYSRFLALQIKAELEGIMPRELAFGTSS